VKKEVGGEEKMLTRVPKVKLGLTAPDAANGRPFAKTTKRGRFNISRLSEEENGKNTSKRRQ